MAIDLNNEIQVYKGYSQVFSIGDNAKTCLTALHLTRQLQDFIQPSLDLGWIMRCILDINSYNKFTDPRGERPIEEISQHPEFKYATILLEIAKLLTLRDKGNVFTAAEYKHYSNIQLSKIYYGNELIQIFRYLVEEMKGDF